jgi:heterotetrameric sarcosine oxidase delta subunit
VALKVPCPNCGWRSSTEFTWGGELRPIEAPDTGSDFERVFLPANVAGVQQERWYHLLGCRRWVTVTRDTASNEVLR